MAAPRLPLGVLGVAVLLLLSPAPSAAQTAHPPIRLAAHPPGSQLTVYLMTMGPGTLIWERFGHNALWIDDADRGTRTAYNYGLFSFKQENFLLRFLQGHMQYWMGGEDALRSVGVYARRNRSVWIQELDLAPAARLALQDFLEWNERPENRFYRYDYYRDNCSTRVRDAIDRVLGGRIQEQTDTVHTGTSYRFHTQRLSTGDIPIYTGLMLALGQPVDREITAWEEMFLPLSLRQYLRRITVLDERGTARPLVRSERTLFSSSAPDAPAGPPHWLPAYLGVGGALGIGLVGLARAGRRRLFSTLAGLWALLVGFAGLIVTALWALTDHTAAYRNENLLQANLLALPIAVLVPKFVAGAPWARRAVLIFSLVVALLSLLGLIFKLHPAFFQRNGQMIALLLPVHWGLAVGAWHLVRESGPGEQ